MPESLNLGHVVYLDPLRIRQSAVVRGVLPGTPRPYLIVGELLGRVWLHPLTTSPGTTGVFIKLHPADWVEGRTKKLGSSFLSTWTLLRMDLDAVRHAAEHQEFFSGPRPRIRNEALDAMRPILRREAA